MARIEVTGRDGAVILVSASGAASLMEVLRAQAPLDIAALCGGSCMCATCHVFIAPHWQDRLNPRLEAEQELLGQLLYSDDRSRLSCQVRFNEALDGLQLTIAPEE